MLSYRRIRMTLPVYCIIIACALVWSARAGAATPPVGSFAFASAPLTVPALQSLDGGQQEEDQFVTERSDPQAVFAREISRTSYRILTASRVESLLAKSFPAVIDHPVGTTSALPKGARLLGYPNEHALTFSLPGHRLGLVESSLPLARRRADGRLGAIDLAIDPSGGGFAPVGSDLTVRIPRRLSLGVRIPSAGLTVTPVATDGKAAAGRGSLVRSASVVYANTQEATDTVVKPTAVGFQLDAVLRSVASPQKLYYRVGGPRGSTLGVDRQTGSVLVLRGKSKLATIQPPNAVDAAGAQVPTSMSLVGQRTVVVSVDHRGGSYLYPIYVDPEINDGQLAETSAKKRSNWEFKTTNESRFAHKAVYEGAGKEHLETSGVAEYAATEFAYWAYETKGNSKIYELKAKTSAKNTLAKIESFLEFQTGATRENKKSLSNEFEEPEYAEKTSTFCAWNASKVEECLPGSGKEKNLVRFQQSATAAPGANYKFSDTMNEAVVSISEPAGEHSTTAFNTTSPEVEGEVVIEGKKVVQKRTNALYGAGIWITNTKGALQMIAKDPGIGVAATHLEYEKSPGSWERLSEHNYLEAENACQGVQCYPEHAEYWTLDPKLPDGEDTIRYRAQEAIAGTESPAEEAGSTRTIKVDTSKPHGIYLAGLPYGNELSERPYKLSATAIDGSGTTVASSGIKKIALFVSGHEVSEVGTQTGCTVPKGECSASAEWTINGAELGAGHHAVVIVATDNAGNEARLEDTISIRHSTPVAIGPGSVDLQSGDFALGSTDASFGSGLMVSRNHSSRGVLPGNYGPLGPQWNLSLGSTESLVEMVDGAVLLTSGDGSQTVFAELGGGKFESPTGDSTLELSLEENKETKQKLAYYLKDNAKHTSVKFTRPTATSPWVPTKQEGTVATDTIAYSYQASEQRIEYSLPAESRPETITTGPGGDLWFTEHDTNKIGKFAPATQQITEYPSESTEPHDIVSGPDGDVWYTSQVGLEIDKMTPAGVVTKYPLGHGANSLAVGPDGNIWYTMFSSNIVGKITTSGTRTEYSLPAKSEPSFITAGPDGNVWFTNYFSSKIGKITPSGTITEYALPAESGPEAITTGPDGKVWFTELLTKKLGKITTTGTITEYAISGGQPGQTLVAGPDGALWFSQAVNKVWRVTTSGVATSYTIGAESWPDGLAVGPDGNIWYTANLTHKIGSVPISGSVLQPTEELAPKPAGVSCEPEMKSGCRALKFKYSTETTATGENSSEWGQYITRLKQVLLEVYEPVSKKMQETAVAEYAYDKYGRLRAEWDPRISPALKTTYGYDTEGHVTAMTPPGQESWAFTYGTSAGDAGGGRLVKVARAGASEALWNGESLKSTETPTLTGSRQVGVRMTVSNGKWSGTPITYGYQWMRCTAAGACTPILGANNANYTPTLTDFGHTLVAVVTATSGGGSVAASSAVSSKIETRELTKFALPGGSTPYETIEGSDGNVWFTNSGSAKIGKVTPEGALTEYSLPSGSEPRGIAVGPDGDVWFVDRGTNKVGKITLSGGITEYGLPSGSNPQDIAAGPDGNLWFTDWTSKKIGKITTSGTITEYALSSNPYDICKGPDGNMWFTLPSAHQIGKITPSTGTVVTYAASPTGSEPHGIVAGPDGNLWFADSATDKVGKMTTAGVVSSYSLAAGSHPQAIAVGSSYLYATETGTDAIALVTTSGAVTEYSDPPSGAGPFGIAAGPDEDMWITNQGKNEILRFNPWANEGLVSEGEVKTPAVGYTLDYNVPLSGSGLPTMTGAEVAKWGQSDEPVEATAILPPDAGQGWPATSYTRANIYYLDGAGRAVNLRRPSSAPYGSITTTEYNETNDVVRTLAPDDRQTALEAGGSSAEVAKSLSTYYSYREECSKESENNHETEATTAGSRLCDVEGPQHTVKYLVGKEQHESLARLHTKYLYDQEAPGGETYNLQTKVSTLAKLANEEEVEVHKTVTSYSGQSNLGWYLRAPTSVTVDPEGKKLTTTTLYNSTTGQISETRAPAGSGGGSAHDTKYVYYTTEANTEGYSTCGTHPEWAGLPCETLPAKQPETSGVPNLPVTLVSSYNMYDEPLVVTETFGSTVRTKTKTYDAAGRLTTSETTSSANTALPKLTDEYNSSTGVLEKMKTTVEGKTQTVTSKYNAWVQLTEYTDADGNIAKYRYGGAGNDGLLEEVADGSDGGTGKQTYSYNATTKQLEELTDSAAGVFTAAYDAEGHMVTETYPNAMCADSTYNSIGEATKIEYIKTNVCSEHSAPVWFSESRTPSVRGETLSRSSSLANETYAYDSVGRLTETQETPSGEGCVVRLYGYDEEGNRTSQTSRAPGGGGKCATEGGTVLEHSYDAGNRLTDGGIAYDNFGDITKLPAADAEGHELSTTYYVDGAVATQAQNGVTNSYLLDPEGRIRETTAGLTSTVSHYDGSGQTVIWTSETGGKSTRNVPGPDGSLVAVQTNGGTPVLQLQDLQGDVVATAALSPSETKLLSTYNSTEFGVPNKEKAPPRFGWLGAGGVASSFSSGVITYGATSYVPQVGRTLQSETVEAPGVAPLGTGAGAAYVSQVEPWVFQGAAAEAAEAPGLEAARERAAAEAAEAAPTVVDPWKDTPMNRQKAEKLGKEFWEWESVAAVLSYYDLPSEFVDILGKFAGEVASQFDDALAWAHDAGEKLVKCAHNKRPAKENICDLHMEENEVDLEVLGIGGTVKWPNFSVEPRVEECKYAGSLLICGYIVGITDKEL